MRHVLDFNLDLLFVAVLTVSLTCLLDSIEVDEHHGGWVRVQHQGCLESVKYGSDCLCMCGEKHELRHSCGRSSSACHVEVVHKGRCVLQSELALEDLGELEQSFQVFESWLICQLVGRIIPIVHFSVIGDVALVHLVFCKLKHQFKVVCISPPDVFADFMHVIRAGVSHVCDKT